MTVSTVSNIKITTTKLAYDTGTSTTNFDTATTNASDSGVALGPVSSIDGLKFYAPKALNDGTAAYGASDMREVTTKTAWEHKTEGVRDNTNDYVGYVKYGIHVTADADGGTARTLKYEIKRTADNADIKSSYRIALYKATSAYNPSDSDKIGIYAESAYASTGTDNPGWKYTTATSTYSKEQYVASKLTGEGGVFKDGAINLPGAAGATVTTAAAISEYYVLSVWIEGENGGAINAKISGQTLKVDVEFTLA